MRKTYRAPQAAVLSENLSNIKAPSPNSGVARCNACEATMPMKMMEMAKPAGSLEPMQMFCKWCIEEQGFVTLTDMEK